MSVNRYVCSLEDLKNFLNISPAVVAFAIYCDATDATSATVQIGGNKITLTITGGVKASSYVLDYDPSNPSRTTFDTFGEMADYIDALDGWYAYLYGATGGDVITLGDVATTDVLGISKLFFVGTTNDQFKTNRLYDLLNIIIEGVTVAFEKYMHRKLDTQEVVEYYDGPGDQELILKKYPIISIGSIYIDNNWVWGATSLIDSDNYTFDPDTGIVLYNSGTWDLGRRNIKIIYTYGWGSVPEDIKLEGIKIAAIEYLKSFIGGKRIGIAQETRHSTQLDSSVTSYIVTKLPQDTEDRLNHYKRHSIV